MWSGKHYRVDVRSLVHKVVVRMSVDRNSFIINKGGHTNTLVIGMD